ncbi:MAG: hypothetical protein JZU50_08375 [Desulfobulbaceae bacterium]|nr:hypothetical protein [Desulfobulbaceae bacterium]
MKITTTTAAELADHQYIELEPGIYHAPGRILITQTDESALLIIKEP